MSLTMATLSHPVTGGRIMFPSPRARTPQSDTAIPLPQHGHTTTTTASSSRSSGFSRFLKRASPGSTAGSQSRTDGKDLSVSMDGDGGKPVRRRAFEVERFDRDVGRSSPDEAGRSDPGIRKSFSSSHLDSPSTSRRTLTRTSPLAQPQLNDFRSSSRSAEHQYVATPSPQNRYGPAAAAYSTYTSSPSPLARRSESRQSLYPPSSSAAAAAPASSVPYQTNQIQRSKSRQSASSSLSSSSSSVFDDPRDQRPHSRATTPRPGDFHGAVAADEEETRDGSFTSFEDDEEEEDDEQSTTPRSELKRWRPGAASASVRNTNQNHRHSDANSRSTRYASEPPSLPDARTSFSDRFEGGVEQRTTRRMSMSLSHGLGGGNGQQDLELESGDRVEMWRSGRESRGTGVLGNGEMVGRTRAALPSEFRNDHHQSPLVGGERPVSRYTSRSTIGIEDVPEQQRVHAADTAYTTRYQRPSQSISSLHDSPIRRSESLHFHSGGAQFSDSPASTSQIKRSATLHPTRYGTESVASPVRRARLELGTGTGVARSRMGTSEVGDDTSSPVGLQRAESRRRRAALLEEMSTTATATATVAMMTPNRPASRMMHDRYAVTDVRPMSRMSMISSSVSGIRPSTSMSSFRASDPSAGDGVGRLDRHGYRSPTRSFSRGHAGTSSMHEMAHPSSRWLRDRVPGPLLARHETRSAGRASSPTRSVVSSSVPPAAAGTSSRIVINRLLAALRDSTGQETREMLQACIALQQNLAAKPAGGDNDVDRNDDADFQQFKQSCQTVAIDANQINANLKAALDIVTRLGEECEASSAEDAQIATISAVGKLGELIDSSSRASDEKIKSLQTVFDRLGSYTTGKAAPVTSHVENLVDSLPIVQEDIGPVEAEETAVLKDEVDDDVEAVEKAVEPAEAVIGPNIPTEQMTLQKSDSVSPSNAAVASQDEPPVPSDHPTSESVPLPMQETPSGLTDLVAAEVNAVLVPAPSSTDISPAQLRTRARKASSSSISVSLSPSNSFKLTRSPLPPTLTHKASFMPSSLSLRTPTTALSRINAGTADEPGFDFDINPKPKPVVEEAVFRLNPLQLEIRTTPTAGRGVFATDDIPTAGTVVEESPVLVLTKKEWDDGLLNEGVLGGYGFNWTAGGMGVGLGMASIFNHSPQPNVTFTRIAPRESEKDKYPTLIFRTTKPIKKGDELYICYSADESKLWFSPNYHAHGNPVESASEETEWCPPMMDEEDELADSKEPASSMEAAEKGEEAPTSHDTSTFPRNGVHSEQTGDQKYLDRKARKQSKREKKVKKPKAEDTPVLQELMTEMDADPVVITASTEPEVPATGDSNVAMSQDDFKSALSKLDLIPEIEVEAEDIDRETALAMEEQTEPQQGKSNEVAWKLVHRVRGLVEAQEGDEDRTVDIWALAVSDKKLMPVILKYLKLNEKRFGALDHVKRVNHQKDKGTTLVAIAPVDMISQDTLQSELADFSASLNHTDIIVASVPATFARTLEEVAEKAKIWPVLLNAVPRHPADTPWTVSRKAWVRKGVQRLVELAQSAAEDGELPIAALAYSAPLDAQPSDPDLIPPTPHMRASGVDRRKGMNHPLKHAAMGCVAEVARLRTCSPFTETTSSTRNGADYLLTSMSLFITHEPCVMCTMALVHSRVKEVFFLVRNAEGGFGGAFDVHGHPGLNHKIDVFDCSMLLEEGVLQRLDLPEGVEP